MLPKKPLKPEKPKIETKEHDYDPGKDQDVIVKVGGFRVYFQNYYTIVSLTNDLFTGVLYLAGSLVQTFTDMSRLGMYLYIFASFFLLMRPVLKILHNVFFYDEEEYEKKVLGKDEEDTTEEEKPSKEVEVKSEKSDSDDEDTQELDKGYNDNYYESQEEDTKEEKTPSKEVEVKSEKTDSKDKKTQELGRGYNDDYYESQDKK